MLGVIVSVMSDRLGLEQTQKQKQKNARMLLKELTDRWRTDPPTYVLRRRAGPEHAPILVWQVAVTDLAGNKRVHLGVGSNTKEACEMAAEGLLLRLC